MHLGARGFVHPELIDPATGAALELEDGATRRARAHPPAPPRRAAAALPHARPRRRSAPRPCACGRTGPRVRCIGRTDDMLIVRGVNVFPSAVREVVERVRAASQRPHPRPAAGAGRQAGAAAAGERRARPRRERRTPALAEAIRERLRERARRPDARRARAVGEPAAQRVQVEARRALTGGADAEAPEPGRPPHHDRRRRPADVDRLLGGRARDAVRLRAAQPRQRSPRATSTSTRATGA